MPRTARPLPPLEYLQTLFSYCPSTGRLFWRRRPREHFASDRSMNSWHAKHLGKEVGCVQPHGRTHYRHCGVDKVLFKAHRIVWKMIHGTDPEFDIDHRDGDGLNNTPANLLDAPHSTNHRNRRRPAHNTSGVAGVSWDKDRRKWRAAIQQHGVWTVLGSFTDLDDATAARKAAEKGGGYTERHGT